MPPSYACSTPNVHRFTCGIKGKYCTVVVVHAALWHPVRLHDVGPPTPRVLDIVTGDSIVWTWAVAAGAPCPSITQVSMNSGWLYGVGPPCQQDIVHGPHVAGAVCILLLHLFVPRRSSRIPALSRVGHGCGERWVDAPARRVWDGSTPRHANGHVHAHVRLARSAPVCASAARFER